LVALVHPGQFVDRGHDAVQRAFADHGAAGVLGYEPIALAVSDDGDHEVLFRASRENLESYVDAPFTVPMPARRVAVRNEMGAEALQTLLIVLANEIFREIDDFGHGFASSDLSGLLSLISVRVSNPMVSAVDRAGMHLAITPDGSLGGRRALEVEDEGVRVDTIVSTRAEGGLRHA
jgi:hypothetical protein